MTCIGILIYWMNTVSVINWRLISVKYKWWSLPRQRQGYVIYVHLNLLIRISIKYQILYIYLCICFNWNGSSVKAKRLLHDKVSKAMYSLIQKGRRLNLPTDVMLKLFDKCVELILLYGYENFDIPEKGHTKLCKLIFGVSKCSHNKPIYGELGRYPLSVTIKQRMVCFWTKLLKSSNENLNKVMHIILHNLYCFFVHLSPWIKCISNIFQTNGINYIYIVKARS